MTEDGLTVAATERPRCLARQCSGGSETGDHPAKSLTEHPILDLLLLDAAPEGGEGRRALAIRERAAGVPEPQRSCYPVTGCVKS